MIDDLERVVSDIGSLNSKLVLLVGRPRSGKSALLGKLSESMQVQVLNVGVALGRDLLSLSRARRNLKVSELFKALADSASANGILLLDNIELLFDRTLFVSTLDLLKSQSRVRRVVAVWPGEFRDDRLSYAVSGHPEYQDHSTEGVVIFKVS
ncbi:BREX-3 system P-loop-containing protein BrxF [Pontitalea aquivivens]|uniref:BREX-3 system P-loop-containing protein BrxF n=1 Tax=Pontitalea aquivivens TaxID=3388663 RepID=UPI003970F88B